MEEIEEYLKILGFGTTIFEPTTQKIQRVPCTWLPLPCEPMELCLQIPVFGQRCTSINNPSCTFLSSPTRLALTVMLAFCFHYSHNVLRNKISRPTAHSLRIPFWWTHLQKFRFLEVHIFALTVIFSFVSWQLECKVVSILKMCSIPCRIAFLNTVVSDISQHDVQKFVQILNNLLLYFVC